MPPPHFLLMLARLRVYASSSSPVHNPHQSCRGSREASGREMAPSKGDERRTMGQKVKDVPSIVLVMDEGLPSEYV